jgi:uncharacterized protein YidB (DUF937 family)
MGLFDEIEGALTGGQGGVDHNALSSLLGNGGLESLMSQFEQGGIGQVAQSWISNGGNLPISQDQLEAVLGSSQVQQLAGAMGIDPSNLSAALPELIHHLTPDGQIPAGGVEGMIGQAVNSGALQNVLSSFFPR